MIVQVNEYVPVLFIWGIVISLLYPFEAVLAVVGQVVVRYNINQGGVIGKCSVVNCPVIFIRISAAVQAESKHDGKSYS